MKKLLFCIGVITAFSSPAVAAELSGTLKRISDRGQINIGHRDSNPPMSFLDPTGKPIGYTIDICGHVAAEIAATLGRNDIQTNFVPVSAGDRFSKIESGEIDLLCGATTKTHQRSERVGFSQLTFVTGASLMSNDDNKVQGLKYLTGRKVAVASGTSTLKALKEAVEVEGITTEIVEVSSGDEAMDMLDKGAVDAYSADQVVLIGQVIARQKQKLYFLSSDIFSYEPFALAFARGDADFELVTNRAISNLSKNGEIWNIYTKWIGRFGTKAPNLLQALYRLNAIP